MTAWSSAVPAPTAGDPVGSAVHAHVERHEVLPRRTSQALDLLNFSLGGVREGLGPYLSIYLLLTHHWDQASIGFVLMVFTATGIIAQTPIGALVDRTPAKRAMLVTGAVAITVAAVAMPLVPGIYKTSFLQAVTGISCAIFTPTLAAITLGVVGPRLFARRIGRNESFNHAGNASAAVVAGGLAYFLGPVVVFWLLAGVAATAVVATLRIPREAIDHEVARGLPTAPEQQHNQPFRFTVLLHNRRLTIFAVAIVVFHFANAAMLPLVGQQLGLHNKQLGTTLMAASIVAAQAVMVPVAYLTGIKADTWGRKPIFLAAFAVLTCRGFFDSLSDNSYWLVGMQLLDGVGAGIFGALFPLVVADVTRGTGRYNVSLGAIITAWGLGASLSNLVAGWIVVAFGYHAAFMSLGTIAGAGFVFYLIAMPETGGLIETPTRPFSSPGASTKVDQHHRHQIEAPVYGSCRGDEALGPHKPATEQPDTACQLGCTDCSRTAQLATRSLAAPSGDCQEEVWTRSLHRDSKRYIVPNGKNADPDQNRRDDMTEPQAPGARGRGRAKQEHTDEITDPLMPDAPVGDGGDDPVELEAVPQHRLARQQARSKHDVSDSDDIGLYPGDRQLDWDHDDEAELPAYDEESEFDADYDDESDLDFGFGPGGGPGHHPGPGHGPGPRLAPGPKHGPGHHPGPPHEHGPGAKKAPGKKAPGKKAPGKKAPGPKKHPGHPPPPPHLHGPGHGPGHGPAHGPGEFGPDPDFGLGPGTDFGFGPGPDFGFGPGPARGRRGGPGPGRRSRRGDVRAAILTLLTDRPMHGYEMIQEIAERSQGMWRPSPGSVYPTLQLLDDEGLIVGSESEGSKKLFELTDEGRTTADKIKTPPWAQMAKGVDSSQVNLRTAVNQLLGAVAQSAYVGTAEQKQRILAILKNARREIYTLLAEAD